MSMGMPKIEIVFTTAANNTIRRGQTGTVALIVKDAVASGYMELTSAAQVPETLTADNQAYVARVFTGYITAPRKVLLYVLESDAEDLTEALDALAAKEFDYLAGPPEIGAAEAKAVVAWVKQRREDYHAICKAVLPNDAANSDAVINFAANGIMVGEKSYTAAQYCSRIAGMLAGTPLTYSLTYATLPEVQRVESMTQSEMDEAVDAGKLILYYNGRTVKAGRAVNSLQTLGPNQTEAYKKIKVVALLDLIESDLRSAYEESYVGRYSNSYDNKIVLLTATKDYFSRLEADGVLQPDSTVEIDYDAQKQWLEEHGVDTGNMTEDEILKANTGSQVFLRASIGVLDAIEDIRLEITL